MRSMPMVPTRRSAIVGHLSRDETVKALDQPGIDSPAKIIAPRPRDRAVTLRRLISGDPHAGVLTAAPERKPVTIDPNDCRAEAMR